MEILHAVFRLLLPGDIANARLTCKQFWNVIGLRYLLPEVHLIYTRESFLCLGETSLNKSFSQHVTSLFIEGDALIPCVEMGWRILLQPDGKNPNSDHVKSAAPLIYDRMLVSWRNLLNQCIGDRHQLPEKALVEAYMEHNRNYKVQTIFLQARQNAVFELDHANFPTLKIDIAVFLWRYI